MGETYYMYRFLALALIIGANAFFAAAEVALVSVRPSRLREIGEQGGVAAQAALDLLAKPQRLLSVSQAGVTLASLGLGWAGQDTIHRFVVSLFPGALTPVYDRIVHVAGFTAGFLLISYLHVLVGEVVPKNLAIEKADRLALLVAPPLLVFARLAQPFVWVIERSAVVLSKALGLKGETRGGGHSAEELKLIVSSARGEGELLKFEEDVIHRILDLEDLSVREIMVPRNDITSVSCDSTPEEILRTMTDHQYSRVPAYEGRPDEVVGILHYKDVLHLCEGLRTLAPMRPTILKARLRSRLRKPPVVPETKPVSQMVEEFRKARVHMAMVVDEFGTIVGLVTFEDILEQVFGEIEDEQDLARQAPPLEAQILELEGATNIRDLETQYGIELPLDAGFETLAGFLLLRLGRIPKPGDRVDFEGRRYTVIEMDRNRIARVHIERLV